MSRDNLDIFGEDHQIFLRQFLKMEESWVHRLQPEMKERNSSQSSALKKAELVGPACKAMASCFLGCKGLLVDYLKICHTIIRRLGVRS